MDLSKEKREKSKKASKCRRGNENYEIYRLATLLPLPIHVTSQLDKASIIRLTISHIMLQDILNRIESMGVNQLNPDEPKVKPDLREINSCKNVVGLHQMLQCIDGFAFIVSHDGRFLYLSDTVSTYLGIAPVQMIGRSILDCVLVEDRLKLTDGLGLTNKKGYWNHDQAPDEGVSMFIRMKTGWSRKGQATLPYNHKVFHITGNYLLEAVSQQNKPRGILGLTAVARAVTPSLIDDLLPERHAFKMWLTLDLSIVNCDNSVYHVLGFQPREMTGSNLYHYCHTGDVQILEHSHVDLLTNGDCMTCCYRLLNKNGGYRWIQTRATILDTNQTKNEERFAFANYVVSGVGQAGKLMSVVQEIDYNDTSASRTTGTLLQKLLKCSPVMTGKKNRDLRRSCSPGGNCLPLG